MKLQSQSLTTKIVLFMSVLCVVCAALSMYALHSIQQATQAEAAAQQQRWALAQTLGAIEQSVADVQQTVVQKQLATTQKKALLAQHQHALQAQLRELANLSGPATRIEAPLQASAQQLLDHAEQLLRTSRTPDAAAADQVLAPAAQALLAQAQTLLQTRPEPVTAVHTAIQLAQGIIGLCGLLLLLGMAWSTHSHITLPLRSLARHTPSAAPALSHPPAAASLRQDEIGALARTLHSWQTSLHTAAPDTQQQERLQLLESIEHITGTLPCTIFEMQLPPRGTLFLSFLSPQWRQLLDAPSEVGRSTSAASAFILRTDPARTRAMQQNFRASAKTLQPVDFVLPVLLRNGSTRWIRTYAAPHVDAQGHARFVGLWIDVSSDLLQRETLAAAKRQAERAATEKVALQANISHEIRTPLNAILGLTQLLLRTELPPAQHEQLHHIWQACQHLRSIVNDVLDFSKIDVGQLQLENTDFSLARMVRNVLNMCQEEARKKGLQLHCQTAPEVPDSLRGDPHRMTQILLNYVNNAIKFTEAGEVRIAIRLNANSSATRLVLHFSVQDTGPGIAADRIPCLFEPFQQADTSITRRFGGTGLGLAISRALAQLMDGSTGVESTLGQGSTFWFTAALAPAHAAVPDDPTEALLPTLPLTAWQGLRVLVVDDNALNRTVAEGMLHAVGLHTDTAEDGEQALHKLQAAGPDYFSCVFMDVQMPHMDGISATRALRQLSGFERLPVIAMTAYTSAEDIERTQAAGMSGHLSKPLLESALHATLQEWLGGAATAQPVEEESTRTLPDFDPHALDALAQLFEPQKLEQLVAQFVQDTQQRAQQLPLLAQAQNWQAIRAEVHKLTGTAATFGCMQLGHLASEITQALKISDTERACVLTEQAAQSATTGIIQLRAYAASFSATPG